MLDMRFRLKDLMAAHKPPIKSAYRLAQLSKGHISATNAHRLVNGEIVALELDTIAVLCDLFGVTPDQLLEHKPRPLKPKEAA